MTGAVEEASPARLRVLVVCTGNVCRSPMAEVVLRAACDRHRLPDGRRLAEAVEITSAGTSDWHAGSAMDPRARAALDAAGYAGEGSVAAQVTAAQVMASDLVVALDRGHRDELRALAPTAEVTLLRWWSEGADLDVFDPYFGGSDDFAACLELVVEGCEALAHALETRVGGG